MDHHDKRGTFVGSYTGQRWTSISTPSPEIVKNVKGTLDDRIYEECPPEDNEAFERILANSQADRALETFLEENLMVQLTLANPQVEFLPFSAPYTFYGQALDRFQTALQTNFPQLGGKINAIAETIAAFSSEAIRGIITDMANQQAKAGTRSL